MSENENVNVSSVENEGELPDGSQPQQEEQKKRKIRVTFNDRVEEFRSALQNTLNETEFRLFIADYGFDEARVQVGMGKVNSTLKARQFQLDERARYREAVRDALAKREKANETYIEFLPHARLAFQDNPEVYEQLLLDGKRARNFGGWKAQVERFYDKTLNSETILAQLAKYDVTREQLEQGHQEFQDVITAADHKKSVKADAEHATQLKNEAYNDLVAWMKDFYKIVEIAFKKNPQFKEKVGIVVPYGI
jgi:hypothetical protein